MTIAQGGQKELSLPAKRIRFCLLTKVHLIWHHRGIYIYPFEWLGRILLYRYPVMRDKQRSYRERLTIEIVDRIGQPRSDKELQEAIDCVNEILIKHALVLPCRYYPLFTTHACLLELQNLRKLLTEARTKRPEGGA